MYQLAIFDLDGTLLDTIEDLKNACNYALEKHGYKTHETEAYKYFVGSGIYKLVERALPEAARARENVLKVKATFDSYYGAHSEDFTKSYEGITALLEQLQANQIKCAVLTNKAQIYARELVSRKFGNLIDFVIGQREGIATKPDPIGIYELQERFDIEKTACIYIGDSDIDMITGNNAQVTTVGVLWGFRTKQELQQSGANYLAETPEHLQDIILSN